MKTESPNGASLMAGAGNGITFDVPPRARRASTNMPGRSLPDLLSQMACTRTLRVASSMTDSKALIVPASVAPPRASDVTSIGEPSASLPSSCCGTLKFTYAGRSACSVTIGAPPARYWPRFTWRMPRRPENGARIVLRSIVALASPTCATACLESASALSKASCAPMPFAAKSLARSYETFVHVTAASAAASCARSCFVSRRTRTSPLFTARPESKSISATTPGRSALTVTPCTAATVPMALSVVFHDAGWAMTVVTASGGAAQLCDIAFLICRNLKPPTAAMNATTTASMRSMRLAIASSSGYPSGLDLRGAGAAGRDPRTAGKNDGRSRAVARLDRRHAAEIHDVGAMYAKKARRFEARRQVLQARVQEMAAAVDVQRDIVVARFQPLDAIERQREHTAALLDEDVRERPRRGEDAGPRGDGGHAVLDRLARPRQHGAHPLAAERLEEVVERVDLEGGDGVAVVRGGEDDEGAVDDLLGDRDAGRAGHADVEEEEVGTELVDGADGGEAVAALVDDVDPVDLPEMLAQGAARERFVVGDDHSHGMLNETSKPSSLRTFSSVP